MRMISMLQQEIALTEIVQQLVRITLMLRRRSLLQPGILNN